MIYLVLIAIFGALFGTAVYLAGRKGAAEQFAKSMDTTSDNLEKAKDAADKVDSLDPTVKRERLRKNFGK